MSPEKKFELGDYVEVKDRIARFYELFAGGRLVTDEVTMHTAPDGTQRVMVKALAYRTKDDPLPGVGHSWLQIPGKTPYTNGSEIENAETSAWGRAIGSLGILIDPGIATANEIADKAGEAEKPTAKTGEEALTSLGPVTRVGAAGKGTGHNSDMEFRETPDGYHLGFLLEVGDGKPRPQVVLQGAIGLELFQRTSMDISSLAGQKVTVDGEGFEVRVQGRKPFYRIVASRLETDAWTIPSPQAVPTIPTGEQPALLP